MLGPAACDDPAGEEAPGPTRPACQAGATTCDAGRFMRCAGDGTEYVREDSCSATGLACHRDKGCVDPVTGAGCGRGAAVCQQGVPWRCGDDGEFAQAPACRPGQRCIGPGFCSSCTDGQELCIGAEVWRCDPDEPQLIRQCDPRVSRCVDGACRSLCGLHDVQASHQGCQFWAVDLENVAARDPPGGPDAGRVSPAEAQFAIAVGNVADTGPAQGTAGDTRQIATVSVYRIDRGVEVEVAKAEVAPGGVKVFELAPHNVEGAVLAPLAYRITADLPVIAYQFNPLNNAAQAFSNDASLLLPQSALGEEYVVATGDAVFGLDGGRSVPWGAFVAVVGTTAQEVHVTVHMTADFEAPDDPDVQVVGRKVTARLRSHEVLSLRSIPLDSGGEGAGNLSGARVEADGPVAVFAGNVATLVPHLDSDNKCCADHLEEQFLPTSAWGKRFLGAGAMVRNPVTPEGDEWRVVAGAQGAQLTWAPQRPVDAPGALLPFESVRFGTTSDPFLLTADEPVQLVHFVKSSHYVGPPEETAACDPERDRGQGRCSLVTGFMAACAAYVDAQGATRHRCAPVGDPAMTLVPPMERWRSEYVFLTPSDYAVDFALILAPVGARMELDGEPVDPDEFEEIVRPRSSPALGRYLLPLSDGGHELISDEPVGLMLFGYDRDVSYGYPGGLDLGER